MKKNARNKPPDGPRGATDKAAKTCMNPHCGKSFVPGHYGQRQLVCTGSYVVKCKKCKGKECRRCGGAGTYKETCQAWYRKYWGQTRRPPRAIPDADFQRILGAVKDNPFWWTYFVVAKESALRKAEQLGLVWADVVDGDEIRSSFVLRGQWKDGEGFRATKVDSGRIAFLLRPGREALAKFMLTVDRENGWLARRIWDVTASSVWSKFTGLQEELGIESPDTHEPYRVHDIRHTAALRTYKATRDITRTQKQLGHKRAATSMIYTEERPEDFVSDLENKIDGKSAVSADQKARVMEVLAAIEEDGRKDAALKKGDGKKAGPGARKGQKHPLDPRSRRRKGPGKPQRGK